MEDEERDSFFEFHGISKEEKEFFKLLYHRRQKYIFAITALVTIIAILIALLCLK